MATLSAGLSIGGKRGSSAARERRTGWHKKAAREDAGVFVDAVEPSAWEKLLRELEVTPAEAVIAVNEMSQNGAWLRRFVDREFKHRYVPEDVLAACGLLAKAEEAPLVTAEMRGGVRKAAVAMGVRQGPRDSQ